MAKNKHSKQMLDAYFKAARDGDTQALADCLLKGISVHERDLRGSCALHIAARNGHSEIVALLLKQGANPHEKTKNPATAANPDADYHPLLFAIYSGDLDTFKLLITSPSDIHVTPGYARYTPFELALSHAKDDILTYLLEQGAKPEAPHGCRGSLFSELAYAFYSRGRAFDIPQKIQQLLEFGANPYETSAEGKTALHGICGFHCPPGAIDLLIHQGLDVNVTNDQGETALHLAIIYCDLPFIERLIQYGANCHLKNLKGHSPMDLAAKLHPKDKWNYLQATEKIKTERQILSEVTEPSGSSHPETLDPTLASLKKSKIHAL